MARRSRYVLPGGIRKLAGPIGFELKLLLRSWLNLLLPHRLIAYRRLLRRPDKRLHLGCGSHRVPGWINLDMNPKGDLTLDLREGLPFADGSVEAIYSEHSFEHFYREDELPFLLADCLRVLRPGARMRATVPDAELAIEYYVGRLDPEREARFEQAHRRPGGTRMDAVNSAFRWKHQHRYMYDAETLQALLEECGFVDVKRRRFRESADEALGALDLESRAFETLYLEAIKPPAPG